MTTCTCYPDVRTGQPKLQPLRSPLLDFHHLIDSNHILSITHLMMIVLEYQHDCDIPDTPEVRVKRVERGSQTEGPDEASPPRSPPPSQSQSIPPPQTPSQLPSTSSQSSGLSNFIPKWQNLITVKTQPYEQSPSVSDRIVKTLEKLDLEGFKWSKESMLKVLKDLGEAEVLTRDLQECDIFDDDVE
ncbi:uncharacterized protein MELLADRAFT_92303 [Melampsora larici-populina 98AG31]|uniref:Uncharacterized protein n=1 Tax=Melampsora larici-populina (strain 98AG31 / pathotype 3-4-7) TaxID=747676 RepID=F4R948_MELLP|nr:uncharacterized protein MELLADRAFT_92303 [Melampsora larici-populina 98AG31]EGG11217.1 hypothetical protein MELLADRAFT_92303 [Melampsora larici-populina 98AG31]